MCACSLWNCIFKSNNIKCSWNVLLSDTVHFAPGIEFPGQPSIINQSGIPAQTTLLGGEKLKGKKW